MKTCSLRSQALKGSIRQYRLGRSFECCINIVACQTWERYVKVSFAVEILRFCFRLSVFTFGGAVRWRISSFVFGCRSWTFLISWCVVKLYGIVRVPFLGCRWWFIVGHQVSFVCCMTVTWSGYVTLDSRCYWFFRLRVLSLFGFCDGKAPSVAVIHLRFGLASVAVWLLKCVVQ
jgi:hypothetical protein